MGSPPLRCPGGSRSIDLHSPASIAQVSHKGTPMRLAPILVSAGPVTRASNTASTVIRENALLRAEAPWQRREVRIPRAGFAHEAASTDVRLDSTPSAARAVTVAMARRSASAVTVSEDREVTRMAEASRVRSIQSATAPAACATEAAE